jgi:proton-translocating NADH-quinone oxidoreductase chain M
MLSFFLSETTTVLAMQVVFAFSVFLVSCFYGYNLKSFRILSLGVSLIPLFWSLYFWFLYDSSGHQFQMVCYLSRLHLSFGIDAVGLSLIVLTSALFPLCLVLMRTFSGILTFLLLEIVILGSLTVLDLLGFYILFEASLILLFLLIARTPYGSIDAAYKIVLYTMAGSLVLLPVIFMIYSEQGTTNLLNLITAQISSSYISPASYIGINESVNLINNVSNARQLLLGWGMLAVFAVKIPLMPVHLWLPEAHVAASLSGSMLLAGVLLKLGLLGIIRFMIPVLPVFVAYVSPFIITLCLVSYILALLSTIRQVDLKKVVAYSSISHMATMTLAVFSVGEFSSFAGTYYMIAHGIVSPALFLLVGILYERGHTRNIHYYSGVGSYMPVYSVFLFYMIMANCSFPLTPGFISEVLCLASIFSLHPLLAFIICLGQILTAAYNFWLYNRICHGNSLVGKSSNLATVDITRFEFAILIPLFVGCLWLGIKPIV